MSITMVLRRLHVSRLLDEDIAASLIVYDESDGGQSGDYFDFGKAWNLASEALPGFPFDRNGRSVDLIEDLDYGPPLVFDPAVVELLSGDLQTFLAGEPGLRIQNAVEESSMYPDVWHQAGAFEWGIDLLRGFSRFLDQAKSEQQAVVALLI